jgi:hypothetical protein
LMCPPYSSSSSILVFRLLIFKPFFCIATFHFSNQSCNSPPTSAPAPGHPCRTTPIEGRFVPPSSLPPEPIQKAKDWAP